jgi:osmoprotectant transport system permease protein
MDTIHYMMDNWSYLAMLTFQHLWLVLLAVGLAIVTGVPLGILIVRHKWLATPVLGLATIVLTIPSIALFGLMIPLFLAGRSGDWRPARYHRRLPLFLAADCA